MGGGDRNGGISGGGGGGGAAEAVLDAGVDVGEEPKEPGGAN